jgi:murein DD-endopeptidase MepM/ murein hydrolase activator NlpD
MGTLESKIAKFIFPFLLISLGTVAYAADTTLRVKSITKDIDVVQSILDDNMISVEGVVNEISHLEYQTLAARKIVRLIDDQGKASTAELDHLNAQLLLLAQEKKLAVERYQTLILEEYKNRDYKTKLYFLASSKNLTEFVNRLNHLNTLKEFRKKQLVAIDNKRKEVEDKLLVYNGSAAQKEAIASSKTDQITKLNTILRAKHKLYESLKSENKKLELHKKDQEENLRNLTEQISKEIESTPKANLRGDNELFKWPVRSGLLVGKFGKHKHSEERKVRVANNGLDILVSGSEDVLCAADGVVKAVLEVPGSNTSIIIDHNGTYTVYSNVKNTEIEVGEIVGVDDKLGEVAINSEGFSKFHFEIWKGTRKVNPEKYLIGSLD